MYYVYCDRQSSGANDLAEALGGYRLRQFERGRFYRRRDMRRGSVVLDPNDVVVCWGASCPDINGVSILNNADMINKYTAAVRLRQAEVPTVEVSRNRPVAQAAAPVRDIFAMQAGELSRTQVQAMMGRMQAYLATPVPLPQAQVEWLARRNNHIGGLDLLRPSGQADYYSKKIDLEEEYRVHIFDGKSIRAGVKRPREGRTPHQWIRSYDGGWSIVYDGFESTKKMRAIAAKAVETLGLTFGAVDIGKIRGTRDLVVLEVNRAAGLEGNTIGAYVQAIQRWNDSDDEVRG